MVERPILFSAPMVRAILDGRKTQTRRVCRPQWPPQLTTSGVWGHGVAMDGNILGVRSDAFHVHTRLADGRDVYVYCPFGRPGDRLWVRETAIIAPPDFSEDDKQHQHVVDGEGRPRLIQYLATAPDREGAEDFGLKATPSIFMPRWASRITLEVTEVRVQRITDITENDAHAEGISTQPDHADDLRSTLEAFRDLWDSINGKRDGASWAANPWVWAITFKRAEVARG